MYSKNISVHTLGNILLNFMLLLIVDPKFLNLFATSNCRWWYEAMWFLMLQHFLRLIKSPKSVHSFAMQSIKDLSCDGLVLLLCLQTVCLLFLILFLLSNKKDWKVYCLFVLLKLSSLSVPKSCLRSCQKKIPMSVGASTQFCLTPF